MYICPICGKRFLEESSIKHHFLSCWNEENPYHISKPALQGKNIETRQISEDIANLFREAVNGRS